MKTVLLILSTIYSSTLICCTCISSNIQQNYQYSSAIFYGKFLGTDTVNNYRNIYGQAYIIDNFEVVRFYRGVDSTTFKSLKKKEYIISLINNAYGACSISFKKDKMYLVYAYREFNSGNLITNSCTRTKEIINNNFLIQSTYDPDFGKDEKKELENLVLSDTSKKYYVEWENQFTLQKDILNAQLEDANQSNRTKSILLYSVFTFSILTISIILYKKRKQ